MGMAARVKGFGRRDVICKRFETTGHANFRTFEILLVRGKGNVSTKKTMPIYAGVTSRKRSNGLGLIARNMPSHANAKCSLMREMSLRDWTVEHRDQVDPLMKAGTKWREYANSVLFTKWKMSWQDFFSLSLVYHVPLMLSLCTTAICRWYIRKRFRRSSLL